MEDNKQALDDAFTAKTTADGAKKKWGRGKSADQDAADDKLANELGISRDDLRKLKPNEIKQRIDRKKNDIDNPANAPSAQKLAADKADLEKKLKPWAKSDSAAKQAAGTGRKWARGVGIGASALAFSGVPRGGGSGGGDSNSSNGSNGTKPGSDGEPKTRAVPLEWAGRSYVTGKQPFAPDTAQYPDASVGDGGFLLVPQELNTQIRGWYAG
ncbi:hypothetical protein ACGF5S_13485 [Nocardia nova]|uniref:hypothetical protein n=1 Tax=Nocardia nova TaxID=37330 RepID=UPI00371397B2